MADRSRQTTAEPHHEAEELLPWYATGQLDEIDRTRVERHLTSCAGCRQQLAIERRVVQEFRAANPHVESGWSRIRSRIEAPREIVRSRTSTPRPRWQLWTGFTRPALGGLVAAQLAMLAVGITLGSSLGKPAYHTLSASSAPSDANVVVMFRPGTNIANVGRTLNAAGASIVGGPTETDAYLLHVTPSQRRNALASLRSDPSIRLAQPIDGTQQ